MKLDQHWASTTKPTQNDRFDYGQDFDPANDSPAISSSLWFQSSLQDFGLRTASGPFEKVRKHGPNFWLDFCQTTCHLSPIVAWRHHVTLLCNCSPGSLNPGASGRATCKGLDAGHQLWICSWSWSLNQDHFISLHITSNHFISLHITSYHFISLHITSSHPPKSKHRWDGHRGPVYIHT